MKRELLALAIVLLCACAAPALPATTLPIDTGANPEAWVSIPAGPYFSGQHAEAAVIDRDYKMMATLVTNAQFARYLNEALAAGRVRLDGNRVVGYYPGDHFSGAKHEEVIGAGDWPHFTVNTPGSRITRGAGPAGSLAFAANPGFENHPVTLVTWFGARAYCEAQGSRLTPRRNGRKRRAGRTNGPIRGATRSSETRPTTTTAAIRSSRRSGRPATPRRSDTTQAKRLPDTQP